MTELNGLNHVGDELLRIAELEYVSRKHSTFAENERNRLATNTAFGMEAYETLPGGERRYLGVDEVARTVRFTKGKFVSCDPNPTLPSGYNSARTALSRIPALLNALTAEARHMPITGTCAKCFKRYSAGSDGEYQKCPCGNDQMFDSSIDWDVPETPEPGCTCGCDLDFECPVHPGEKESKW